MQAETDMPVPGMDAVNAVGANGANDSDRCQTANKDPYRFVVKAPHVPNPDNMGEGD